MARLDALGRCSAWEIISRCEARTNRGILTGSMMNSTVSSRYRAILERINTAANSVGRSMEEVKLVVVTKGHPVEAVRQAVTAGASAIGENYLEEAEEKIRALQDQPIEWRMIGHVQSRKASGVCQNFDAVDSVDSLKLAQRLDHFARERKRVLPVLLECNVSGEQTKSGFPAWQKPSWSALAAEFAQVTDLPNLDVRGLMTMPPYFDAPEQARPYFQMLVQLRDFLESQLPQVDWVDLSMGMSGDFEVAIQEGATMVRIGTAIMGERPLL